MQTRRQVPSAAVLASVRALLLDAAARDPGGRLAEGFARFGSWDSLAAVAGTAWLPIGQRFTTGVAARTARRWLRFFGSEPAPIADLVAIGDAEPVHVRGLSTRLGAHGASVVIWRTWTAADEAADRAQIDEAADFVLTDAAGTPALVLVDGGRLVNSPELRTGDEVSVFGFVDAAPDRVGLVRAPHGRGDFVSALRSSPEQPLLVSLVRRYPSG
jgi:hypothetical protein